MCCNPPQKLRRESWKRYNQLFNRDFWRVPLKEAGCSAVQPRPEQERTEPWHGYQTAHKDFLRRLTLSSFWTQHLLDRGFDEKEIAQKEYKSTPNADALYALADVLFPRYESVWQQIPGFDLDDEGLPYLVVGTGRLIIPIRDHHGEVHGLQVRKREGKPKYAWFSKNGVGGPVFHHNPGDDTLLLTEGPLKADLTSFRTGWRTLSYQGVSCLGKLGEELSRLPTIRRVFVANDADFAVNPAVFAGTQQAVRDLQELGLTPELLVWDTAGSGKDVHPKGIDDFLLAAGGTDGLYRVSASVLSNFPPDLSVRTKL